MLESLVVDSSRRGEGVGTKLLGLLEEGVVGRGARYLAAELRRIPAAEGVKGFLERRGYGAWEGLGLAKRHPLSSYRVKELVPSGATSRVRGGSGARP